MEPLFSDRLKKILSDSSTRKELQELLDQYHIYGFASGIVGGVLYTIKGVKS